MYSLIYKYVVGSLWIFFLCLFYQNKPMCDISSWMDFWHNFFFYFILYFRTRTSNLSRQFLAFNSFSSNSGCLFAERNLLLFIIQMVNLEAQTIWTFFTFLTFTIFLFLNLSTGRPQAKQYTYAQCGQNIMGPKHHLKAQKHQPKTPPKNLKKTPLLG